MDYATRRCVMKYLSTNDSLLSRLLSLYVIFKLIVNKYALYREEIEKFIHFKFVSTSI